ncbi:MAG: hypothetical protein P4N60_16260 [Verrucomicrobiae bacterium]|nr:hypothetical protein [Verrucomicrobiae bacterium]
MKNQTACVSAYLVAAIWLLGQSVSFGDTDGHKHWWQDPCDTNVVTQTCVSSGSIQITDISISPTCTCPGTPISASAVTTNINGQYKILSRWIAPSTNCPDSTNYYDAVPILLSSSWVVSGPSNFTASGTGLSASFTPTNVGNGTITFSALYTNSYPCSGSGTATSTKSFSVHDPVLASSTINFMDPNIHSLDANGTQWEPVVATVALTAQLIYCGGATATIHITGVNLKSPACLTADPSGSGAAGLPADITVDAGGGSMNWPESYVGNPSPPPPGSSGAWDTGDGYWVKNTGWGRWTVITWSIDQNNCSATLSFVQQKPF